MPRRRARTVLVSEEADRSQADVLKPLRVCAAVTWLTYALLMGLLMGQLWLQTLHPQFLPFVVLLCILLVGTIFTLGFGLWRLVRGPKRVPSVFWSVVALLPLLSLAAPCEYARRQWQQRRVFRNLPMDIARMVGASLMEGQAAFLYPHRLETERLVMFYDRLASPRRDIEMMDQHVARLEKLLGRALRARIYWVRGSLVGQSRLSFYGLALGSAVSPADWNKPSVDRHELAHAVLEQQRPLSADPPTFLHEGWAEAQSGETSAALARRAMRLRAAGQSFSLRELISPKRYHLDDGPAYEQGGAFVDFLIRRYGVGRFLELYNAATPAAFPADCRRILEVDLDALDTLFWQDARQQSSARPHPRNGS